MAKKAKNGPTKSSTPKSLASKEADQTLLLAAERGDLRIVEVAIITGADLAARNDLDNTPLCAAASAGHLDIVKLLVEKGADVNLAGYCDMTALTLAARDGHVEVVKYLLDHGAASSERVVNDAIQVGSMSASGKPVIVELLRNARLKAVAPAPHGMKDADARMMKAAGSGDVNALESAIREGADVHAQDDRGMDALSWAALRGHNAVVEILLNHGADINALNSSGWPPIGQACGQGRLDVMKTLIARGANLNLIFDGGRTALMCAAYQGYVEIVKDLLKAGADKTLEYDGINAQDLAAQRGNSEIIALLKD